MKVSELTGVELDYWVAKAEGFAMERKQDMQMIKGDQRILIGPQSGEAKRYEYSPSTNWVQGGPIIEREGICLDPHSAGWDARPRRGRWAAHCPTPLIAAMRAYVISKFGEEVGEQGEQG